MVYQFNPQGTQAGALGAHYEAQVSRLVRDTQWILRICAFILVIIQSEGTIAGELGSLHDAVLICTRLQMQARQLAREKGSGTSLRVAMKCAAAIPQVVTSKVLDRLVHDKVQQLVVALQDALHCNHTIGGGEKERQRAGAKKSLQQSRQPGTLGVVGAGGSLAVEPTFPASGELHPHAFVDELR